MWRVLSRISSMITCAAGRVCQSANSNWMTPIVSSVISFEPCGCSPTRVYTVFRPLVASTTFSTWRSAASFSSSAILPRPCTMT
jgi:hypothetical protein